VDCWLFGQFNPVLVNHDQTPKVVKVRPKTPEFEVFTVFSLYFSLYFSGHNLPLKMAKTAAKSCGFGACLFTVLLTDTIQQIHILCIADIKFIRCKMFR
jgi:hypothetical protein